MDESCRFKLVYSKIQEVLDEDSRRDPRAAHVEIRNSGEISREEMDEIARLREIVLETVSPDPVSFTTT